VFPGAAALPADRDPARQYASEPPERRRQDWPDRRRIRLAPNQAIPLIGLVTPDESCRNPVFNGRGSLDAAIPPRRNSLVDCAPAGHRACRAAQVFKDWEI